MSESSSIPPVILPPFCTNGIPLPSLAYCHATAFFPCCLMKVVHVCTCTMHDKSDAETLRHADSQRLVRLVYQHVLGCARDWPEIRTASPTQSSKSVIRGSFRGTQINVQAVLHLLTLLQLVASNHQVSWKSCLKEPPPNFS